MRDEEGIIEENAESTEELTPVEDGGIAQIPKRMKMQHTKNTKLFRYATLEKLLMSFAKPCEVEDKEGVKVTMTRLEAGIDALTLKVGEGDVTTLLKLMDIFNMSGYCEKVFEKGESNVEAENKANATYIQRIYSFLDFAFFSKKNIVFVYGTTRSGKTYTIIQWLLGRLDDGTLSGQSLIAGQTVPFLRNGSVNYINELLHYYPNLAAKNNGFEVVNKNTGAKLVAQSFEDKTRALSAQWQNVFLNECNTIDAEVVDALRIRCNGLVITDFNPSVTEWWGAKEINDSNKLFCTFKDNQFLNSVQIFNIEQIRERGENAPVGSYAHWYYQVYYLGNFSTLGGGVFTNIIDATDKEFNVADNLFEVFAIDLGDVEDPNAIVRLKWDSKNKIVHVKCELYQTAIPDAAIVERLTFLNAHTLVFETATGGHTRALNWRAMGLERTCRLMPCEKTTVAQGVFNLSQNQIVCYDKQSLKEFSEYIIRDGKFSGADHIIDATRYGYHLLETGRIKNFNN